MFDFATQQTNLLGFDGPSGDGGSDGIGGFLEKAFDAASGYFNNQLTFNNQLKIERFRAEVAAQERAAAANAPAGTPTVIQTAANGLGLNIGTIAIAAGVGLGAWLLIKAIK